MAHDPRQPAWLRRRRRPGSHGPDGDVLAVFAPFVVVLLLPYALQLTAEPRDWRLVLISLAVTVAVIAARTAAGKRVGELPETALALAYMGAVIALWIGGIEQAGNEVLLLLVPILWTALFGSMRQLGVIFVAAALCVFVPYALDADLRGIAGGWQELAIGVAVGLLMGWTVFRLVRDLNARSAALQTALDQLDVLARRDALTGVANRRAWNERIAGVLRHARETGTPICVAMLDLDRFKDYNDDRGHAAGDRLLVAVGAAWTAALRPDDLLARIGGDEFLVALPACDAVGAATVVERLRRLLPDGQTCSAGVVCWDGVEHAEALVNRADQALYRAKTTGRDRVAVGDATDD